MSFASILSEPATRATPSQDKMRSTPKATRLPPMDSSIKVDKVKSEDDQALPPAASAAHSTPKPTMNGYGTSTTGLVVKPVTNPRKSLTAREHERISRAMEALDSQPLSDVEDSDFAAEKERYAQKSNKRALELEEIDNMKRKVCQRLKCPLILANDAFSAGGRIFLINSCGPSPFGTPVLLIAFETSTKPPLRTRCMKRRFRRRKNERKICSASDDVKTLFEWKKRKWPKLKKEQT